MSTFSNRAGTGIMISNRKNFVRFSIAAFLMLLITAPMPGYTGTTTACHCFRQRDYNPEAKFAADDYLLATCFNSLTARSFNISKRQIIMLKMKGGIHQDDLLIALRLSRDFSLDLQQLVSLRQQGYPWKDIVSKFKQLSGVKGNILLDGIRTGRPIADLGREIADAMVADFYGIPKKNIEKSRNLGFGTKEITLLFFLVRTTRTKPDEIVNRIKNQKESWSEIAHAFGISPAMAGKLIENHGSK